MVAYNYRYYRFSVTAVRTLASALQISEFAMINGGVRLTGMSISATNNSTNVGEEAAKAGDNSTATKWCNLNGVASTLVYDFGVATTSDGYRWATANDATGRDPKTWTVDGSNDGANWTTLDAQTDYATTTSRLTFLPDILFATPTPVLLGSSTHSLTLLVQVAWGADLTADPSTWVWYDITSDVLVDGGEQITYSVGRQDEAATSQSASCNLRLDNRTGAYSRGPQASNWPNVRRSTPLRVQTRGDTTAIIFQGYVDSWAPSWDTSGRYAVVDVAASGPLRRLMQGRQPVLSSLRRAMRRQIGGNLIAYWPMEDRKGALYCGSDIPGHPPLAADPTDVQPKFAASAPFACSDSLPNLNYSWLTGRVPAYTHTGELQFRALVEFPANGMNDGIQLMSLNMDLSTSTVQVWTLAYGVGGTLRLDGTDVNGATLADSLARTFDVDGLRLRVTVSLVQNGADIDYTISTYAGENTRLGATATALQVTGTFAGVTLGRVVEAHLQRGFTAGEPVVGHYMVQNEATGLTSELAEFAAWNGEGAINRFERLCEENGIPFTTITSGAPGPAMGPQSATDLVRLLRECETADQGMLFEGVDGGSLLSTATGGGLIYRASSTIGIVAYNQQLNAVNGRLRVLEPVDDDQQLRNQVTATRTGGGTITRQDATGPLGTDTVGIYDESVDVNCASDAQLPDYAGWLINLGTVEGYRYPRIEIDLRDLTSSQAADALSIVPYWGFQLINVSNYRTQLPTGPIDVAVVGWSGAIDKHRWEIAYNTAPLAPHRVAVLDTTTEALSLRLNTSGSTLASSASAGATSLSVATTSGPLWTTDASDMPVDIEVGDLPVTVSAISGAASPQTFTISALTLARSSGVSVTMPRTRAVLGLDDESGG